MSKFLTFRQREIYDYLKEFLKENGYPPTVREISKHFEISSPSAALKHLKAIEKKGYIIRKNVSRGLQIVDKQNDFQKIFPHKFYDLKIKSDELFDLSPVKEISKIDFFELKDNYIVIRFPEENMACFDNNKNDLLILKHFIKREYSDKENIFLKKNGNGFEFTKNYDKREILLKSVCIISRKGV